MCRTRTPAKARSPADDLVEYGIGRNAAIRSEGALAHVHSLQHVVPPSTAPAAGAAVRRGRSE
jgi:hypothetical protein